MGDIYPYDTQPSYTVCPKSSGPDRVGHGRHDDDGESADAGMDATCATAAVLAVHGIAVVCIAGAGLGGHAHFITRFAAYLGVHTGVDCTRQPNGPCRKNKS